MSTEEGGTGLLAALSEELATAVERAGGAVVTVEARRGPGASGILWPAGHGAVVTADHVLERDEGIAVVLPDGRKVAASIAGRDPGTDIAVLRLEPLGAASEEGRPVGGEAGPSPAVGTADLAPAESVRIGHLVMAVARPRPGAPMASFGMVSALGGPWRTARGEGWKPTSGRTWCCTLGSRGGRWWTWRAACWG